MEKNTLDALLKARQQLLEFKRKQANCLAVADKEKEFIKNIVNAYATRSTNEFIFDIIQELIRQRLNDNMKLEVISIAKPIKEYVSSDLSKIGDAFVLVNHIINNSSSEDISLSFEQYLILAYYCNKYRDIYFLGNKGYIIDDNLFKTMVNELGITRTVNKDCIVDREKEKYSYKSTHKLCIGKDAFDTLLENMSNQSSNGLIAANNQGISGQAKR